MTNASIVAKGTQPGSVLPIERRQSFQGSLQVIMEMMTGKHTSEGTKQGAPGGCNHHVSVRRTRPKF